MVSITPSPDFSKLQVHVMKLLLDNACVFHWCSQGQCAQNRIHGVPSFPVPPSTPQMSGSHPVSTPHPPHRQSPRNLPRLFFPLKPTFSLDSPALHALQAIFTLLPVLSTTCSSNLFNSLCHPWSACCSSHKPLFTSHLFTCFCFQH